MAQSPDNPNSSGRGGQRYSIWWWVLAAVIVVVLLIWIGSAMNRRPALPAAGPGITTGGAVSQTQPGIVQGTGAPDATTTANGTGLATGGSDNDAQQ